MRIIERQSVARELRGKIGKPTSHTETPRMPLNQPLLENWTPEQAARIEKAIFVAQHRMHELA